MRHARKWSSLAWLWAFGAAVSGLPIRRTRNILAGSLTAAFEKLPHVLFSLSSATGHEVFCVMPNSVLPQAVSHPTDFLSLETRDRLAICPNCQKGRDVSVHFHSVARFSVSKRHGVCDRIRWQSWEVKGMGSREGGQEIFLFSELLLALSLLLPPLPPPPLTPHPVLFTHSLLDLLISSANCFWPPPPPATPFRTGKRSFLSQVINFSNRMFYFVLCFLAVVVGCLFWAVVCLFLVTVGFFVFRCWIACSFLSPLPLLFLSPPPPSTQPS